MFNDNRVTLILAPNHEAARNYASANFVEGWVCPRDERGIEVLLVDRVVVLPGFWDDPGTVYEPDVVYSVAYRALNASKHGMSLRAWDDLLDLQASEAWTGCEEVEGNS